MIDDDDEYFGSQDEDYDSNLSNEFGRMGVHECQARDKELRNIGFLDAYDEYKESRLQEVDSKKPLKCLFYLESYWVKSPHCINSRIDALHRQNHLRPQ
jgi:hypothetical protein